MSTNRRLATTVSLVVAASLFIAVAVADLTTKVASGQHLHGAADYAFEALLLPYVLVTLTAVWRLRELAIDPKSRAGQIGLRLSVVGLLAFLAPGIATLATGDTDALGPVYFLAELLSVVGISMLGYALTRAERLPRWVGPVLAIGWLLGSPVLQNLPGVSLVGAAAFLAVAASMVRTRTDRQPAGVPNLALR